MDEALDGSRWSRAPRCSSNADTQRFDKVACECSVTPCVCVCCSNRFEVERSVASRRQQVCKLRGMSKQSCDAKISLHFGAAAEDTSGLTKAHEESLTPCVGNLLTIHASSSKRCVRLRSALPPAWQILHRGRPAVSAWVPKRSTLLLLPIESARYRSPSRLACLRGALKRHQPHLVWQSAYRSS